LTLKKKLIVEYGEVTPADIIEEQEGQAGGGLPETFQFSIQDVLGGPSSPHPT